MTHDATTNTARAADPAAQARAEKKELRSFGLIFGAIVIGLFGLLLPWLGERALPRWPFAIGIVFMVLALVFPLALKPFFKLWMKFGAVMGFINTRIILALFFYVLVTPIGWVMRALKHDPMRRQFESDATSYRVLSKAQTKEDLEKPY